MVAAPEPVLAFEVADPLGAELLEVVPPEVVLEQAASKIPPTTAAKTNRSRGCSPPVVSLRLFR
jgi:hypothetical protein